MDQKRGTKSIIVMITVYNLTVHKCIWRSLSLLNSLLFSLSLPPSLLNPPLARFHSLSFTSLLFVIYIYTYIFLHLHRFTRNKFHVLIVNDTNIFIKRGRTALIFLNSRNWTSPPGMNGMITISQWNTPRILGWHSHHTIYGQMDESTDDSILWLHTQCAM